MSKLRAHRAAAPEDGLGEVEVRLATTIRQYRLKHGMSQADLARAVGVRNTAVSRWELLEASISADALLRLAHVFEVPIGALFGDQPPPVPSSQAERSRMLELLKLAGTIQDQSCRNALLQVSRVLSRRGRDGHRPANALGSETRAIPESHSVDEGETAAPAQLAAPLRRHASR